jgi:ribosome biogenesis protein ENP2
MLTLIGTYKPQIHVHNLDQLSLSFARHTDALNETFILLSSDYGKSLHLQSDRSLEFHTPGGCHYKTRIPRYGRGLVYDRRSAEVLVPAVGVNEEGSGEVFRLNLEQGRFMKGYQVDVGNDDRGRFGAGSQQGSVNAGSVNAAAVAEDSHNLLAFGTSLGTVEFWDSRSKNRAGILSIPQYQNLDGESTRAVTALTFHHSGLSLAAGSSNGLVHLYDLRSPLPLLKKDQGYGYPILNLIFLESASRTRSQTNDPKILSADKRIIKIWDPLDGNPWTSVEPAVDLHHVEWCRDSGMLLTANEGKQQHAFFIPQLGPAPKWCAFLDNLVEEMAEDPNDPQSFGNTRKAGEVYDNYKFLTLPQLKQLNMDHLVGKTGLLRPYMHGFFVNQKLYEEAMLINNPTIWEEQKAKSIKEKIDKERESRIRGKKKVQVKVNRKLAERIIEREEKNQRRKAIRILAKGGNEDMVDETAPTITAPEDDEELKVQEKRQRPDLLKDGRFARLFQEEEFEVDEGSWEFQAHNPSSKTAVGNEELKTTPKTLTAAEEEALEDMKGSSNDEDDDDDESSIEEVRRKPDTKFVNSRQRKQGQTGSSGAPKMRVSTSAAVNGFKARNQKDKSFGARAVNLKGKARDFGGIRSSGAVGEKEISFMPTKKERQKLVYENNPRVEKKDRRSASGNTFRRL